MEEYYQKVIHLQERLRQSEDERLRLEMKFNEMMQEMKEEEEAHFKKLRGKYKKFLQEDRRRQQRNDKILEALDRIENRAEVWEAKTERFKIFRRKYHAYVTQARKTPYGVDKAEETDDFLLEPNLRDVGYKEDEDDIVKKYLKTLSSEKQQDVQKKIEKPPENRYSNLGNINSIYAKKSSDDKGSSKNTKDLENALKQTNSGSFTRPYDYTTPIQSKLDKTYATDSYLEQKPLDDYTRISQVSEPVRNNEEKYSYDSFKPVNPQYNSKPYQETEYRRPEKPLHDFKEKVDDQVQRKSDVQNQFPHAQQVHTELEQMLKDHKQETQKTMVRGQPPPFKQYDETKQVFSISPLHQPQEEAQKPVVRQQPPLPKQYEERKLPSPLHQPQKETQPVVRQQPPPPKQHDERKLPSPSYQPQKEVQENIHYESVTQRIQPANLQKTANEQNESESFLNGEIKLKTITQEVRSDPRTEQSIVHEEDKVESKAPSPIHKQQDTPEKEETVKINETEAQKAVESNQVAEPVESPVKESEKLEENTQSEQPFKEVVPQEQKEGEQPQQYDSQQPQNYNLEQPSQPYDENGQPVHYDENGHPVQYDENGQPIQPYYEDNGQYYDQNGQPVQNAQYYGSDHGVYDANGQLVQYDETGQPITQYDENGAPILQYDENGQAIGQYPEYDPNAQIQYDENGQPIAHYGGGEYYDENGQPYYAEQPQYDENGQPIQPYDQQYYQEGQELPQQEPSHQEPPHQEPPHQEAPQQEPPHQEPPQQDPVQESPQASEQEPLQAQEEPKKNVMEMLETDTESAKQDTKVSNESDFDFSNG